MKVITDFFLTLYFIYHNESSQRLFSHSIVDIWLEDLNSSTGVATLKRSTFRILNIKECESLPRCQVLFQLHSLVQKYIGHLWSDISVIRMCVISTTRQLDAITYLILLWCYNAVFSKLNSFRISSLEDPWCFNEKKKLYYYYKRKTKIIVGGCVLPSLLFFSFCSIKLPSPQQLQVRSSIHQPTDHKQLIVGAPTCSLRQTECSQRRTVRIVKADRRRNHWVNFEEKTYIYKKETPARNQPRSCVAAQPFSSHGVNAANCLSKRESQRPALQPQQPLALICHPSLSDARRLHYKALQYELYWCRGGAAGVVGG